MALVVVLFGVSSWWGARSVSEWRASGRPQLFYQEYFEPAVMVACGRGFVVAVPEPTTAVSDFLRQRTDTFDCVSLPADLAVTSVNVPQYAWYYLMMSVALAWKVLGVSWSGLVPFFGVLFGTVVVLAYALFRTAVPPLVALPGAVALTLSSLHLQNLPHLRDYAKAPFVLALILILFWMVKRPMTWRALVALGALYGVTLGIGYGFRTDLLASIPPLVLAVLFFVPGDTLRNLGVKAGVLAAAAVMFVAASWPAAAFVVERGGCQWHVTLLGLDDSFSRELRVAPSYYQWSSAFSDEYLHTSVNSYLYRTRGAAPVEYCSAEYDAATLSYLREIVREFPGDVLTRAYASVLRVVDLPFYWWNTLEDEPSAQRSTLGRALTYIDGTARLAVGLTIVMLGATSIRLGLFALCLVLYFGGFPSMQFANRHFFHLEFIGWFGLLFLAWQACRAARALVMREGRPWHGDTAPSLSGALRFAVVAGVLVLLPLPVVRAYQDRTAATLVQSLLDAPRVAVPLLPDADGLRLAEGAFAQLANDATETAYLDVKLDLSACPEGVPLGVRYDASNPFRDFTGPVRQKPAGTIAERMLVPVYRSFQGLSLGGKPASCVASVERLASIEGRALLPVLTLPREWLQLPAHQALRR